ncbi:hypothetical protein HanRHA438_Chr01g0000511 [Helianthus annuus]|nr:hypothetical protein HanRHA438_Chr01g0000511 [Helianthus annuus]
MRGDMKNTYAATLNLVMNEMDVELSVLGSLMLNGVTGEINSAHVVTIDKGGEG